MGQEHIANAMLGKLFSAAERNASTAFFAALVWLAMWARKRLGTGVAVALLVIA